MRIDNFNLIEEFIKRKTSIDEFYFLQIYKRRKDNPEMEKDMIVIDNFFIKGADDLIKKRKRIVEICINNNARAYIRLNKRSFKKVALQTLRLVAENIANEQYDIKNCYLLACGQYHSDNNKTWVVDLDKSPQITEELFNFQVDNVINMINRCEPLGEKLKLIVPTKNGLHLITNPFNIQQLTTDCSSAVDIHKDNPTILFSA